MKYDFQEQAKKIWSMYQKGLDYQNISGLSTKIPQCVDFYEGRQWPKATEKTKSMPRPIINVTRMIVRNKKAGILSNKTAFVYNCSDPQKAKQFNYFGNYITKELGQEKLDRSAVQDGAVKGTYIYHYYWDGDAVGKLGNLPGGVRCEIIDPLNIFVSNPNNDNEQAQEWIIIRSRVNKDTIEKMCDSGVDKSLIVSDDNESKYGEKEQDEHNICTLLTRYFRQNGEVYYEKAIHSTIIVKPRPLHPNIKDAYKKITGDDVPNEEGFETKSVDNRKVAYLYPIAIGPYEKKDKSIFGIGEVEGIIPNQKSINANLGLQLLNVQNVWGGKYIVSPTALRGQKITNDPGQVLVDYSSTMGGIKKITEQVYNDVPLKILEETMNATRVVTGATEVMTGETIGANTSGAAILQLQSQALKPIEELQQAFWDTKAKCGKILEMFYKLYYENTTFSYSERNLDGTTTENIATFNGSDYIDTDFDVTVEVIGGAKGSEVSLVNALDGLLQQKQIDLITYFELYPQNALPNKTEILDALKQREQSQIMQLSQQNAQYETELKNAAALFEKERETIQNAINILKENENLQKMIVDLRTEYANKIGQANQMISQSNSRLNETYNDARELAKELYYATNSKQNNEEQEI